MRIIFTTFSLCSLTTNWPPWLQVFSDSKSLAKLSKLKQLDLGDNRFDKEILRFLSAISALKFLKLDDNGMEGPLYEQGMLKLLLTLLQNIYQLTLQYLMLRFF